MKFSKYFVFALIWAGILFYLFLLQPAADKHMAPKLYCVDSLIQEIDDELCNKLEKEFLFTLPENAFIEKVSLGERENAFTCCIEGEFEPEEFIEKHINFIIGEKSYENGEMRYKINGFPEQSEDNGASLRFEKSKSGTRAIIFKHGFRDKTIPDKLDKVILYVGG